VRTIRRLFSLLLATLLLGAPAAFAEDAPKKAPAKPRVPMLWEVDTKPKIYLFGTIHIADERVLAHPPVVQKALDETKALYTEIRLDESSMAAILPRIMLPPEESLKALLPEDVYARTDAYFTKKGMPLKALDRVKIWAVWLQLQGLDAPKPKPGQMALDALLYQNARKADKTVDGLEKLSEQIDIFDDLTRKEQIRMLDEGVKEASKAHDAGENPLEGLTQLYLAGDADALFNALFKSTDMKDPLSRKLLHKLLDERNVRMVRRMLAKAEAQPDTPMFVAVGTGHYPGEMGILNLLRKTGFRVRKLESVADMNKPWPLVEPKPECVVACRTTCGTPRRATRRRIRFGPFCLPGPCCPSR